MGLFRAGHPGYLDLLLRRDIWGLHILLFIQSQILRVGDRGRYLRNDRRELMRGAQVVVLFCAANRWSKMLVG